ncbi:MAG: LPP20 family lipoprotein [Treponema sp.]
MADSISKRFFTTICIFLAAFLCFAKSSKMPDWVTDYRTIYPDSEYIVQRGRADTEETSRTEAIAQIARYFQTSVNANLKTSIQSVSRGQNVNEITTVVNDVDVMSQVDLFVTESVRIHTTTKRKRNGIVLPT